MNSIHCWILGCSLSTGDPLVRLAHCGHWSLPRTYVGWTRSRGSSWRQVARQEREPVLWKTNMTALVKLCIWGTVRCREFCMHRKSGWMALADAGYKREQVGLFFQRTCPLWAWHFKFLQILILQTTHLMTCCVLILVPNKKNQDQWWLDSSCFAFSNWQRNFGFHVRWESTLHTWEFSLASVVQRLERKDYQGNVPNVSKCWEKTLDRTKLVPVTLVYCHTEFATCICDYVACDCISFCSWLPEFESHRMPFCAIMRFSQLPMRWQRIGGMFAERLLPTAYRRHSLRSSTFFPRRHMVHWDDGIGSLL